MNFRRRKNKPIWLNVRMIAFVFGASVLFGGMGPTNVKAVNDQSFSQAEKIPSVRQQVEHAKHSPSKGNLWTSVQSIFGKIRTIHPLLIAVGQLLAVAGICLLMTDNRELELYLKIDFKPPKVDILN